MNFNLPQMQKDEATIFHYTSEQGILGIFQQDKIVLQLTRADCMNDFSEGKEVFIYLEKVCNDLFSEKILNEEQHKNILSIKSDFSTTLPVGYFLRNNSSAVIDNMNIGVDSYTIKHKQCDIYIMSFCKEKDLLPMWNYYAAYGQQGYSIHFDSNELSLLFEGKECYTTIEKVIYKDEEKYKRIREEIEEALKKKDDYLAEIKDRISSCQYLFKNAAFEYEQEKRYIVGIPKNPEKGTFDIKFKTKKGTIMPYIELEFDNKQKFIVKGVTIGPFADVELVQKNLQFYLEHKNHIASLNIGKTNIPVRF